MTRTPFTLSLYIGRQFLVTIGVVVAALAVVAMLLDTVELLRRSAGRTDIPVGALLALVLLKVPYLTTKLLPYGVLIGSMLTLTRLTKSQELVVARAAGVSVWQFLAPAVVVAAAVGVLTISVFNPLASAMLLKHEKIDARVFAGQPSLLTVSSSGLWMRQVEQQSPTVGEHIIHALRISPSDLVFSNLVVFTFDKEGRFSQRLDAEKAALTQGMLTLVSVVRSEPGKPPEAFSEYRLPTTLKLEQIQDSFASPETISFWKLPGFIAVLENAGFSALKHRLYLQSLLSTPLLFAGMVLIAALFSLRLPRLGKISLLLTFGIATGFMLHFFTDIIHALGMAGTLPIGMAAWAPAAIILMLGAGTLLHLEDG